MINNNNNKGYNNNRNNNCNISIIFALINVIIYSYMSWMHL